jgi:hypothetical protein
VGGVSAAVSKTAAAPIERVKLLIQNQVRTSFQEPEVSYAGLMDCIILSHFLDLLVASQSPQSALNAKFRVVPIL